MLPRPGRHNAPASIDIGVAQTESSAFPLTLGVRITAIPLGDATSPPATLTAESCRQFPAAACVSVNDSLASVELIKGIEGLDDAHVRFWFADNFSDVLDIKKPRKTKQTKWPRARS